MQFKSIKKVNNHLGISSLLGVSLFVFTLIYFSFLDRGALEGKFLERVISIIALASVVACKASLCICITAMMMRFYNCSRAIWLVNIEKDLKFLGGLVVFGVSSFVLLNRCFDREYPKVMFWVMGLYLLTIILFKLQSKLILRQK